MPNLIQDVTKPYMVVANTMESLLIFRSTAALNVVGLTVIIALF